jgi:hypothetical protein
VEALRRQTLEIIRSSTVLDIVADIQNSSFLLEREAWRIFYSTKDGQMRLAALQFLRQNRTDMVKTLQSLGAVYEEPKTIRLRAEQTMIEKLRGLPPELQQELAQIRDHDVFLHRLETVIGADLLREMKLLAEPVVVVQATGSVSLEEEQRGRGR